MSKKEEHRKDLGTLQCWDDYLLKNSNLPGPRANLELLDVVAELGDEGTLLRYASIKPLDGPVESPKCFLACCGVAGLGKLIASGRIVHWALLREKASDPRWRVREAVAIALQFVGDHSMPLLLEEMQQWMTGSLTEQRAAMAGLCEPRLLRDRGNATKVIHILGHITGELIQVEDRRSEEFRILRQALGYGWSVAIVALPEGGLQYFNRFRNHSDKDIQWIVKENLKKNRMIRLREMGYEI
jgi:hypothetical protein